MSDDYWWQNIFQRKLHCSSVWFFIEPTHDRKLSSLLLQATATRHALAFSWDFADIEGVHMRVRSVYVHTLLDIHVRDTYAVHVDEQRELDIRHLNFDPLVLIPRMHKTRICVTGMPVFFFLFLQSTVKSLSFLFKFRQQIVILRFFFAVAP